MNQKLTETIKHLIKTFDSEHYCLEKCHKCEAIAEAKKVLQEAKTENTGVYAVFNSADGMCCICDSETSAKKYIKANNGQNEMFYMPFNVLDATYKPCSQ